jgi:hypothetical protein
MAKDTVLLDAYCRVCELSFDLWAETEDGERFDVATYTLRCPNCLTLVAPSDINEKESLA